MHRLVAKYVQDSLDVASLRTAMVRTGEPPAQYASLKSRVDRLEAELGLTPMGLQKNRWEIVADEVGERRDDQQSAPVPPPSAPRRVLRVAGSA